MAETKAEHLQPVRLSPETSAPLNPTDPWASFPMAPPPDSIGKILTLEEIQSGKPNETPVAPEPLPAKGSDPWAAFPKADVAGDPWSSFPKAGELRGYDLTKLKATKVDDLVKDTAEFNPVEFYAKNTDALLADPHALDLVEKAYEQRENQKMSAKDFFLKANPVYAILHPIQAAKTAGKIVTGGAQFVKELGKGVGQVFATGGEVAGNLSRGDLTGAAKGISEAANAFDTAQQHWVTTITSKTLPRPDSIRERLAYDADFKRREIAAAAGNGELAKALGTDQEGLKNSGVHLDTDAIQRLSVIEDPMFLVPIGGAIGVVGRGGKFLLGRATSPAAAEAFAKTINGAMDIAVGGAIKGPGNLAGKTLEKVGAAIEKSPELMSRVGAGNLRTGGIVHALATGDLSVLASTIAAPIALKYTGKGLQAAGRGIQAAAPVAGKLAVEGAKGAAEATALTLPLFIGSTPEEREGLLGMIGGAAGLRAGAVGAGAAGHVAARAAQEKLASKIYEPVSRGPIKESPQYGTDGRLDYANTEQTAKLPAGEQSVLNWAREFFRESGVEIYALDKDTFKNNVPNVAGAEAAEGFFTKRGERIGPDGTRQPVVQVLLNRETNGLGHELYHAFKSLDPRSAQALEAQITKTWTPEEQAWIADTYNSALNGGKPKSQWTVEYDKHQILEEAAAEVFGRVLNATDLGGVRPSIVKRASEFAGRALEKMGYPLGGKALPSGPGVSALGVRPGAQELTVARDFLKDITARVQDGTLSPPKAGPRLEADARAGAVSRRPESPKAQAPSETPAAPAAPQPATPPPLPVAPAAPAAAVPPPAPATTAPNIRVTPEEQANFAAERSKVTNADQGIVEAGKTGKTPEVQAINDSMAAGHAVEIVHKGVIREGGPTPETPVSRGTRRAEQEAAYVAEAMGAVPDSVREPHQKLFFGTRWIKDGKQLTARSVDKALANIKNAVDMAADKKVALPYEVDPAGKLTESGWSEAVQDLKDYWSNQDRGFRGDGQPLTAETRTRDIGQSIPPQSPDGPVAILSPERTDFLNLVQGLNIPATARSAGKVPGNVKGQLLAEMQGRKPATPAGFTAADVQRTTFKPIEGELSARSIKEVNPLRNELRAAGAPVDKLIEVTENIKQENIESVTPRPDVAGRGGSTDITRGGFSVKSNPELKEFLGRLLDGSKSGQTFNFDGSVFKPGDRKLDVVTMASQNFKVEDLTPEAVQAFVDKYPEAQKNPDATLGLYTLPGGQVSVDLNVVVDQKHRNNSLKFAEANNQVAIYDLANDKVLRTLGTGTSRITDPAQVAAAAARVVKGKMYGPSKLVQDARAELKSHFDDFVDALRTTGEGIKEVSAPLAKALKEFFFREKDTPIFTLPEGREKVFGDFMSVDWASVVDTMLAENPEFRERNLNSWDDSQTLKSIATELQNGGTKLKLNGMSAKEKRAFKALFDAGVKELGKPPEQRTGGAEMGTEGEGWKTGSGEMGGSAREGERGFDADWWKRGEEGPPEGKFSVAQRGEDILKQSTEDWTKTLAGFEGGLTKEAFRIGLGLTDRADLTTLKDLISKSLDQFTKAKEKVQGGDFDALDDMQTAAFKKQFFQEAYEAATGTGGKALRERTFPGQKPPFEETAQSFSPATAKGKELAEKGWDFRITGELGNRTVSAFKNGVEVGYTAARQMDPKTAELAMTHLDKRERGQGAGEAMYRELFNQLKKDGVELVEGMAVAPEPLALRNKIFGGFEKLEAAGEPISLDEALIGTNLIKKGVPSVPFPGVDAVNRITPDSKFSVKPKGFDEAPSKKVDIADDRLESGPFVGAAWLLPDGRRKEVENAFYHDDTATQMHEIEGIGGSPSLELQHETGAMRVVNASGQSPRAVREYGGSEMGVSFSKKPTSSQKKVILDSLYDEMSAEGTPMYNMFHGDVHDLQGNVLRSVSLDTGERGKIARFLTDPFADEFDRGAFSVRRKRETEAEANKRVAETDYSKYNVPEEAKELKTSGTGWFFPDKEFVPINQEYHEQFLAENSKQLNEKYGTNLTPEWDQEQRLVALNKGFIRSRYQPANGRWHIEANADFWKGAKDSVYNLLEKHEHSLDRLNVNLLDRKGQVVDQISVPLHELEGAEKLAAVKDALDGLKTQAKTSPGKGPSNIQRVRSFSVKPAEERTATAATGEHVTQKKAAGTPEFNAYTQNKIEKSKEFPEAFPLEFRQDKNGNFLSEWDGEPLPKARSYELLKSDLAEKTGSPEKFRDALAKGLKQEYRKAKKNPEVANGEQWYSTFRERVGGVLGDDAKLFAELLGATSPQQAVGPNFKDALGAYNQFKNGAYDAMLDKYREGKKKFAEGDLAEFTAETGKTGKKATKEAFLGWWQKKHDLIPKKVTGKKFGMNSRAVLRVLDGSWLEGVKGPKTPNFTGNLSGTTFKATIDVWAMRLLSRLANQDSGRPWRIQPANETGVSDKEFFFGQEAFQKAADDLGIKADALQAILWFAEKDLWAKRKWNTESGAGRIKGDFNTMLARTTKTPEGRLEFTPEQIKKKSKSKSNQPELFSPEWVRTMEDLSQ